MIARRSKRVTYKLEATVIADDKIYNGLIENFSKEGILKIISYKREENFKSGMVLVVNFQVPSGQKLNLNCEIKWLSITEEDNHLFKHNLGMEILNPPQGYTEFVQSLYNKYIETD